MKKLLIAITLLITASAFADQCALISKQQAEKALKITLEAQDISSFCEPCIW